MTCQPKPDSEPTKTWIACSIHGLPRAGLASTQWYPVFARFNLSTLGFYSHDNSVHISPLPRRALAQTHSGPYLHICIFKR